MYGEYDKTQLEKFSFDETNKKTLDLNSASNYMVCGTVCDSTGCWNTCRRPDGHSGEHQCDNHGGSN